MITVDHPILQLSTHMSSSTLVQSTQQDHSLELQNLKTSMNQDRRSITALPMIDSQVLILTLSQALMKDKLEELPRPVPRVVTHSHASVSLLPLSADSPQPSIETLALASSRKPTSAMSSSQTSMITLPKTTAQLTDQTSHQLTTVNVLMMLL